MVIIVDKITGEEIILAFFVVFKCCLCLSFSTCLNNPKFASDLISCNLFQVLHFRSAICYYCAEAIMSSLQIAPANLHYEFIFA
jgi:hypothetical protein